MMQRLTTHALRETAKQHIGELLRQHAEWLFVSANGQSHALRRSEIDVTLSHDRLVLSCWTEKGTRTWRILSWQWNGQTLVFQASRRFGAEQPLLELVPRASATAIAATIRAARQIRCDRLAQLVCERKPQTTIERCALSPGTRRGQPGRYARILLRRKGERIAVTGPVISSNASSADAFVSSALLWLIRIRSRVSRRSIDLWWVIDCVEACESTCCGVARLPERQPHSIRLFFDGEEWNAFSALSRPTR